MDKFHLCDTDSGDTKFIQGVFSTVPPDFISVLKMGWNIKKKTASTFPFQGFIVMPFLCYYLQVHDCMIAILGDVSCVKHELIQVINGHMNWYQFLFLLK